MNKIFILAIVGAVAVLGAECPTKKADCSDDDTSCAGWAKIGECAKNPDFMKKYCSKSCCNICTGENTEDVLACPTDKQKDKCVADKNKSCQGWAAVDDEGEGNECDLNPAFMIPNCMQSCCTTCQIGADKCPTVKAACGNKMPEGSDTTECDVEETRKGCPKCEDDDFEADACKAQLSLDGANAKQFPKRLACIEHKRCVDKTAADKKVNDQCAAWAKAGECKANPEYMNANCNVACCPACQSKAPAALPTTTTRVVAPVRSVVQQPVQYVQQPIVQQPVTYVQAAPVRSVVQQPVRTVQQPVRTVQQPVRTPVVRQAATTTLPYRAATPAFGAYNPLSALPQQFSFGR